MTITSLNTPIYVDDGFNEYENALKRQKSTTSKVWDEMTKRNCENKNELKAQSANLYFRGVWKVHKVLLDTIKDFVQTILSNLTLLFDEYVKKSKSTSSSLARSSNVSDNDPVDFSLHQHNVNMADLGGDYDESDDYKRYLNESSTKSEKSQLDI
ncbi:hypothetical protein Gogos_021636 [Gossypium gossypioides]|uniref:Uncharacterized protein n=1 Tax=Gossypium gossypioides TaxID=34282 RepID=A0A7J9D4Y4_GOSGO|nr:hypothetical protein [Gossypium gossypioides]